MVNKGSDVTVGKRRRCIKCEWKADEKTALYEKPWEGEGKYTFTKIS
jgi:hypothetical protein